MRKFTVIVNGNRPNRIQPPAPIIHQLAAAGGSFCQGLTLASASSRWARRVEAAAAGLVASLPPGIGVPRSAKVGVDEDGHAQVQRADDPRAVDVQDACDVQEVALEGFEAAFPYRGA